MRGVMGMNIVIRPLEVADAKHFLNLSKEVDNSNYMLYAPGERKTTIEQQQRFVERISADEYSMFFVAEVDGKLVGFIGAMGSHLERTKHAARLVLGVLEAYQGQGIATRLFQQVFEWAEEKSISRLELTVMKDNVKAFQLYRKMGFVLEGEKVHALMIDGEPVNEYYLYKLV